MSCCAICRRGAVQLDEQALCADCRKRTTEHEADLLVLQQKSCLHEFMNGRCRYCGATESP